VQLPAEASNGMPAQTARYLSRDHQKWNVSSAGSGGYKLLGAASGLALTVIDGLVKAAPYAAADSQLWKIDQVAVGSYRIASKSCQLALTATIKLKAETGLGLQAYTGDDTQRWAVTEPGIAGAKTGRSVALNAPAAKLKSSRGKSL